MGQPIRKGEADFPICRLVDRNGFMRQFRRAFVAIVTSIPSHVADIGCDGIYQTWNEGSEIIFGYDTEQAVGKMSLRHLFLNGNDFRVVWNLLKENNSYKGEVWLRKSNGKSFAAWLTIIKHFNPDGGLNCYVVTAFERKEQRRVKRQLKLIGLEDLMSKKEIEKINANWGLDDLNDEHGQRGRRYH